MKKSKASEIDGINTEILKASGDAVSEWMMHAFNVYIKGESI